MLLKQKIQISHLDRMRTFNVKIVICTKRFPKFRNLIGVTFPERKRTNCRYRSRGYDSHNDEPWSYRSAACRFKLPGTSVWLINSQAAMRSIGGQIVTWTWQSQVRVVSAKRVPSRSLSTTSYFRLISCVLRCLNKTITLSRWVTSGTSSIPLYFAPRMRLHVKEGNVDRERTSRGLSWRWFLVKINLSVHRRSSGGDVPVGRGINR